MLKKYINLIIIFIVAFNNSVYALDGVSRASKTYLEYNEEILLIHENLVEEIVEHVGKIELTYDEALVLERAGVEGITYLSYPGSIESMDGTVGIERFNADVISSIFNIEINLITIPEIDESLENSFVTSLQLLNDNKVDIIGKFNYLNEPNLSANLVSSDPYAKDFLYEVHLNKTELEMNQAKSEDNLYQDGKYAITKNLSFLNEINYFGYEAEIVPAEDVYDKLVAREFDYYLTGSKEMSEISQNKKISSEQHDTTRIYPNNVVISKSDGYGDLVKAINKIYTPEVLEIYDEYSDIITSYSRIYTYIKKESEYTNIPPLKVGLLNIPSLMERKDGQWTGYIVSILKELTDKFGVEFAYYDYTELGYEKLIEDFMADEIDLVPIITELLLEKNKWGLNHNELGILDFKESANLEIFYEDGKILDYYEQLPLRKIGIYGVTKDLTYSYIEAYVENYDNIITYYDLEVMFNDLKEDKINLVYDLEGTEKYLKTRNAYVYNTLEVDIGGNYLGLVKKRLLDDGEYLDGKLTDLIDLVDIDAIKNRELKFDIDEKYVTETTTYINIWFSALLLIFIFSAVAFYILYRYSLNSRIDLQQTIRTYKGSIFYNRTAFIEDVISSENKNLICSFVHIKNIDKLNNYYGSKKFNAIFDEFILRLSNIQNDENFKIYFLEESEFIITANGNSEEKFAQFLKSVMVVLDVPYYVDDLEEKLQFNAININMMDLKNNEEALHYFNYFIKNVNDSEENVLTVSLNKEKQEEFNRYSEIIKILTVENIIDYVRLKFRPVINIETNKIIGAQTGVYLIINGEMVGFDDYYIPAKMSNKMPVLQFEAINKMKKVKDAFYEQGLIDKSFVFSLPVSNETVLKHSVLKDGSPSTPNYVFFEDIQLEINEEILESSEFVKFINLIEKYNFRLAINNFSAGHSSMEKLEKIDLENIILNSAFMESEESIEVSLKIKKFIEDIGYKVIYNKVTTKEQRDMLRGVGVKYVVGDESYDFYSLLEFKELIIKNNSKV